MNISTPGTPVDWDPCGASFAEDQIQAYDELRQRNPVAFSESRGWAVLRHADVVAALTDPETFSSRVSVNVAVPNGMDPPEHTAYREVVDRCFRSDDVAAFQPTARRLAAGLIDAASAAEAAVDLMTAVAEPFAAAAQCAYLGWPDDVGAELLRWARESARATATADRAELDRVAAEFDGIIGAELARAASPGAGGHGAAPASPTMTQRLVRERVYDRHLSSADLVSMMRNWTAGELGTIAAAVGIIVEFLARRPDVSELLREQPRLRQRAIDEMLRLDAPLIRNRRRTTASVAVGDRTIPGDAKVTIVWAAAQRDPDAFTDATEFRLDRDPSGNLLYGRGPHACPGEGLARVELGAFLDEWLDRVPAYEVRERVRARYPSGGFSRLLVAWGQA